MINIEKLVNTNRDYDYYIEDMDYYPSDSRYRFADIYESPSLYYYQKLPNPYKSIPVSDSDSYYKVPNNYKDRIDLIAHKFYNNSKLWWVIALANDIDDPYKLDIGTILRIPDQAKLYSNDGILQR